jgi:Short repeat of unknown function (DUF308)
VPGSGVSERNCHVRVSEHVPDRARRPALAVGIIALAWPTVTVLALVIVFAAYAFMAAGLEAVRTFSSPKAGPASGHLLVGLAPGVVALAWRCWPRPASRGGSNPRQPSGRTPPAAAA